VLIFWVILVQKKNTEYKGDITVLESDCEDWKRKYYTLMQAEEEAKEKKNSMETGNSSADFDASLTFL